MRIERLDARRAFSYPPPAPTLIAVRNKCVEGNFMSKVRPLRFESLEPRTMLTAAATGAFSAANTIGTFLGATSVQTADIDKDGDLDVLATSTDGNGAKWFENKRGGAWVAHTITT